MTPSEVERIATLEVLAAEGVRQRGNITQSVHRTASRVGALEESVHELVVETRARRNEERRRQKRLDLRLRVLTFVVACAAVVVPVTLTILGSH